jgi:rod shape-determining protein MreD
VISDVAKAAVFVTVAAVVQVAFVDHFELVEGHADIVLLALTGVSLLRGPLFGAIGGFWAGLILDVATLGNLGLTSLVLTIAGYWAGRIGDVTSNHENQRARILLAMGLLTICVTVGTLIVHLFLGDAASVGTVAGRVLAPSLGLNLLLAIPAYWLSRRLLPPPARREREMVAIV